MRTMRGTLLACATVLAVSCATAPPPRTEAFPAAPGFDGRAESQAYRQDLEAVYAQIVAHEQKAGADAAALPPEDAGSFIHIPQHRSIPSAVSLFSNQLHGDIQTYFNRSARYRKLIEKALADVELPKSLAWLPVIESGYTPTMTSRSGAHGIWQFMPDTAREYGLRVDWWIDERADPERSTRAAAQYLKDLYRQFNDWPLTLAAYNAGPGRIRRALTATGATTFWELVDQGVLSQETRGYVPTFFATLVIAADPASYGFTMSQPSDVETKRVDVDGPLSLRYLARVAEVDESTLRDLNPALRRGVLPPGRSSVRVPSKAAEAVVARATTLKNEDDTLAVCSFTLREGDSLKRLARALGTSVDTLLAMNGLRSADAASEGDSLYLPVRARDLGALLAHADDEVLYAVNHGDTLYSIAKKHGLTVAELCDLNDIPRTHKLHRGEKLRVTAPRTLAAGGGM